MLTSLTRLRRPLKLGKSLLASLGVGHLHCHLEISCHPDRPLINCNVISCFTSSMPYYGHWPPWPTIPFNSSSSFYKSWNLDVPPLWLWKLDKCVSRLVANVFGLVWLGMLDPLSTLLAPAYECDVYQVFAARPRLSLDCSQLQLLSFSWTEM